MISFEVGCDIVQIDRVRSSLAKKILSKAELEAYQHLSGQRAIEYLAGHFAAKEAIFKTLGRSVSELHKIEIRYDENLKPYGVFENQKISVSISHEKEYAVAFALRVFDSQF